MNNIGFSFGAVNFANNSTGASAANPTDNQQNSSPSFDAIFGAFESAGNGNGVGMMGVSFNNNSSSNASADMACMGCGELTDASTGNVVAMGAFFAEGASDSSSTDTATTAAASPNDQFNQLLSQLQEVVADLETMMQSQGSGGDSQISSAASILGASSPTNTSFAEDALASSGPLPQFLAKVDAEKHLNPTQQAALQQIAQENMNAPAGQQTVNTIAGELAQAGISETPV